MLEIERRTESLSSRDALLPLRVSSSPAPIPRSPFLRPIFRPSRPIAKKPCAPSLPCECAFDCPRLCSLVKSPRCCVPRFCLSLLFSALSARPLVSLTFLVLPLSLPPSPRAVLDETRDHFRERETSHRRKVCPGSIQYKSEPSLVAKPRSEERATKEKGRLRGERKRGGCSLRRAE